MMYPMAWMLVTSFKTNADIRANRTKFLPTEWTLEGYRTAFAKAPIGQWFLNSMLVVICITAGGYIYKYIDWICVCEV